jgi:serine/threonine protein kinase
MQAIGRFRVSKKLGEGSQGSVWLCLDPDLQRPVAIKLLDRPLGAHAASGQGFLQEARAISRLQHPNIVSIFDLGQHAGKPYLVFEYIEGELLSGLLAKGTPALQQTLDLFGGLLAGLDQVHRQGLVHRDLKPSNIIISREGVPKIMDFGIAQTLAASTSDPSTRVGTPRYMAPEYISDGEIGTHTDLFAMGAILFEMLTGRRAFEGEVRRELLGNILHAPVVVPSSINPEVGERLDAIVLKALEKQGAARYQNAGEMLSALVEYREIAGQAGREESAAKGTVEFLLRRMQHKNDFPILSESIRTLNRLATAEVEDVGQLADVIIRDFALTNKILKVVNSAYYSRFAGKIGTVSRAIVVLGMKTIRSIAASLIFFEHMHDKTQASRLKDDIASAVFSATLAMQAAEDAGMESVEECFLCAMLHNLGRILVTYYLDEESEEVERLVRQEGLQPERAEQRVLGMTFEQIGIAIARQWNFPTTITHGMARVDPTAPGNLNNLDIKMRLIASFANEAAQALGQEPVTGRPPPVRRLLKRYRMGLAISERRFESMVTGARLQFQDLIGSLTAGGTGNGFIQRLNSNTRPLSEATEKLAVPGRESDLTQTLALDTAGQQGSEPGGRTGDAGVRNPEAVLTAGLQEVSGLLLDEEVNLSQLFNVVLESIYRGMAFQRVLLCLQDVGRQEVAARLGFGVEDERFMAGFRFPVRYSRNVFHAALKNGVDLHVSDTLDPKIQGDIPAWYRKISRAGSFLIFPLMMAGKPLGLIYADHPMPNGVGISEGELNLLKALRNQIVLAFHSRAT